MYKLRLKKVAISHINGVFLQENLRAFYRDKKSWPINGVTIRRGSTTLQPDQPRPQGLPFSRTLGRARTTRDQTKPGSLRARPGGKMRDPGNAVAAGLLALLE